MLRILSIIFAFSVFNATASHMDKVCSDALQFTPAMGAGVIAYRATTENGTRQVLDTQEGQRIYTGYYRILSVVKDGENFWLLHSGEIVLINSAGELLERFSMDKNLSMNRAGDDLIIVRGGGTVTSFNMKEKKINWTSYLPEVDSGMTVAAAYNGQEIIAVMATSREGGFTGMAMMNPENGSVTRTVPYDVYRAGVIGVDVSALWANDKLVINNSGWIHVVTEAQLKKGKPVKPRWVAHAMGTGMDRNYMTLRGEFVVEEGILKGCGSYYEKIDGEVVRFAKYFEVSL